MLAGLQAIDGRLGDIDTELFQLGNDLMLAHPMLVDQRADQLGGSSHIPILYARDGMSIRARKAICQKPEDSQTGSHMARPTTFLEILEQACKAYPRLWKTDENGTRFLNLAAVERHYAGRGHRVTQANLYRLCYGKQRPGPHTVDATFAVFGVPRAMLRGEPLSPEMERVLGKTAASTLFLAERIEQLEQEDYREIVNLLELLEQKRKQLEKAIEAAPNVHSLPKKVR